MNTNYVKMNNQSLHGEAIQVSKELRAAETKLIELVGLINDRKVYIAFECTSIFDYTEKYLQLKYNKTCDFLKLYNASKSIPELKSEIENGDIGYTKLRTVLPALEVKASEKNHSEIKSLLEKQKLLAA